MYRKSGIDIVGGARWGAHLCVFYNSKEDLVDILVPYFKAGLENNEFCVWIISGPINTEEAKIALQRVMPDLDRCFERGQIEILPHSEYYLTDGDFDPDRVVDLWTDKLDQALVKGFAGLRAAGDTAWLKRNDWKAFALYEEKINKVIKESRISAVCAYSLDQCGASEIISVINNHQAAIIRQDGRWEFLESSAARKLSDELIESEEKFRIIFNGASDGILVADQETGKFLIGNKKICQMLGYSPEEIGNIKVTDIHPEEDLADVLEQFDRQKTGGLTLSKDLPVKKKDGGIFYADVNATPITLAGRPYLLGIFRDITERKRMEKHLKEQKESLEQKNLALQEMIEHIERTKNRLKEDITINVDQILMPIIKRLKIKKKKGGGSVSPKYIKLFEHHLENLTSSFGRVISQKTGRLTSREIEICNMIKSGLSSKDISSLLGISVQTIEKHRRNIRKKIGLSHKKTNLSVFLRTVKG